MDYPQIEAPRYDERPVFDLFAAYMQSQVIEIALRVGVFEALREPSDIPSLCRRLSVGERAAETILTVLAACGMVDLSDTDIRLKGIAREYFLRDSPFFKGSMFGSISNEQLDLLRRAYLQDGSARPTTQQWLAGQVVQPEKQAETMHAHTFAVATVFARHPAFASVRNLLDVGGGAGTVSIALARQNPSLHCTVMDLPPMRSVSIKQVDKYAVAGQVAFRAADMFTSAWGTGYDAILLSNVFHNWERDRCIQLAKNAFGALSYGGRIFVNEMLLNENKDGPMGAALLSAMMLFHMKGRQFTLSELTTLVEEASFTEVERIASFGYYTLLMASKLET